ncbi:MAG: TRAP transporter small permease [Pseudomonadota bacterium]
MHFLEKNAHQLAKILYWIAGGAVVSMMLLSCVDIVLRLGVTVYHQYRWAFLSEFHPIPGTFELVCFFGVVAVSFAMAHTSVEKGHVSVSLIVRLFPQRVQAVMGVITNAFGFIFFALLCWRSIAYAIHLQGTGEVSMTLQLPFYPFVYGIAFSAVAVCLILLVELSKELSKVLGK